MKKFFLLMSLIIVGSLAIARESKWQQVDAVVLPTSVVVHQRETSSGNTAYYVDIPQIGKLTVSPGTAEKYENGDCQLELIKWRHKESGDFKYSIRQMRAHKKSPDVELKSLFR